MHDARFPRRLSARFKVALSLGLGALVTSIAVFAFDPPSEEELKEQLARRQAMIAADPPRGDVLRLDGTPDAEGTANELYKIVLDLVGLEQRAGDSRPSELLHIRRARMAATDAFEGYGDEPDTGVIVKHLRTAGSSLQAAAPPMHPEREEVQRISGLMAMAAEAVAEDMVDLAHSAGVERGQLRALQVQFEAGRRALRAQQYSAAIGMFGGVASFASNDLLSFDIDLFEQKLRGALEGQTVGYAYSIGLNGERYLNDVPDWGGLARTSADSPETDQSPTKEMYIASMTKTISAVALLKALDEAGISVDSSIAPHLPESWVPGQNVSDITFRYLMTHQSGLDEAGNQTLTELQQSIANGTEDLLAFSNADYTNTNYSLLRILIPQIVIGQEVIDVYTNILPADQVYASLYEQYVSATVLTPAGINAPDCAPKEALATRTLYYLLDAPASDPGADLGDWGLSCGATGYYLSAVELGSLLAYMRYTNDVIDDSIRDLMNSEFLGWLNPKTFADMVDSPEVEGDWGIYRAHGGDSSKLTVPGMIGCMMNYPINVEAVVLVNSRGNNLSGHVCTVLRDAYDDAWVAN